MNGEGSRQAALWLGGLGPMGYFPPVGVLFCAGIGVRPEGVGGLQNCNISHHRHAAHVMRSGADLSAGCGTCDREGFNHRTLLPPDVYDMWSYMAFLWRGVIFQAGMHS